MRTAGVPIHDEYIRKGDFTVETASLETMALCRLPDPPTAIFSFNNNTTYGCLRALGDMHWKVGRDISIIGFDDIEELTWLHCDISVVSRDVARMGRCAMERLAERVDARIENRESFVSCVDTELILRGSEKLENRRIL